MNCRPKRLRVGGGRVCSVDQRAAASCERFPPPLHRPNAARSPSHALEALPGDHIAEHIEHTQQQQPRRRWSAR
jgi:hypothetical protein